MTKSTESETDSHVYPTNDLRDHVFSPKCWCKPVLDEEEGGRLWVHNAMDQREKYENLEPGKLH